MPTTASSCLCTILQVIHPLCTVPISISNQSRGQRLPLHSNLHSRSSTRSEKGDDIEREFTAQHPSNHCRPLLSSGPTSTITIKANHRFVVADEPRRFCSRCAYLGEYQSQTGRNLAAMKRKKIPKFSAVERTWVTLKCYHLRSPPHPIPFPCLGIIKPLLPETRVVFVLSALKLEIFETSYSCALPEFTCRKCKERTSCVRKGHRMRGPVSLHTTDDAIAVAKDGKEKE